jgi:hypothetical protein
MFIRFSDEEFRVNYAAFSKITVSGFQFICLTVSKGSPDRSEQGSRACMFKAQIDTRLKVPNRLLRCERVRSNVLWEGI